MFYVEKTNINNCVDEFKNVIMRRKIFFVYKQK